MSGNGKSKSNLGYNMQGNIINLVAKKNCYVCGQEVSVKPELRGAEIIVCPKCEVAKNIWILEQFKANFQINI